MASEHAIEVDGLSKAYRMYRRPIDRIVEAAAMGKLTRHAEFWALRDVSFQLPAGGSLGLVGANGAGKSTLLKLLSGITAPTAGRFRLSGRVASLLELGAGFHSDFTGRANIITNGVMMGFSRREMESRIDEIVEFAELGSYIDEPVRTYSSGMGLRLGFAIAVAVDPEILIIDEVFAVGDMYFQKKCVDKIYEFRNKGKTIVFCSHSLYDVRQLCDEALWLREGRAASFGRSIDVTNEYTSFQHDHIGRYERQVEERSATDERALPRIRDARLYRLGTDEECYQIRTGESLELRIWWENPDPAKLPIQLGIGFMRQDLTLCGGTGTHFDEVHLEGRTGCTVLELPDIRLLAGQFMLPVILFDGAGVHKYQEFLLPENLVVKNERREEGLFRFDFRWRQDADRPVPRASAQAVDSEASRA